MSGSPFLQAAEDLVGLGYNPIPIMPPSADHMGRGKAPGTYRGGWWGMTDWQRLRDRGPTPFELQVWGRWPDANIGIVLGTPAGELKLIAVDIDAEDPEAFDDLVRCLPATPMRKKGHKGETRFYRASPDIKTGSYSDGNKKRLVDMLTGFDTRQTVCPPSIHPNGETYQWLQGPVRAEELPVFDDYALERLEDTLRSLGWDNAKQTRPAPERLEGEPEDIWTETKRVALEDMDAWVPHLGLYNLKKIGVRYAAVPVWRDSALGSVPLHERKRSLSIHPLGIKDVAAGDTYSAIDLTMKLRECSQDEATSWLRERLGLTAPVIELRLTQSEPPAPEPPQPPEDLPEELTRVPGLLGKMVDWICDTSRRPQRSLALGAALTVLGTAAGRRYAGPTRSATHLYIIGLARSGAGKDHALTQIATLLNAGGLKTHIGPSQFMSLSAVVNSMVREPLKLSAIDEFASFLQRVNSKRASTHEQAISGFLRTLWGASFKTVAAPEWASKSCDPIHAPALSIYGVSVHEEFYAALSGSDVLNGFLNRFLLFSTLKRPKEREPKADPFDVPEGIAEGLKHINGIGGLYAGTMHNGRADKPLAIAEWEDPDARRIYEDLSTSMEELEEDASYFARTAEIAVRLATIRAIGIDPDTTTISEADMAWGRDIALWSSRRMKTEVQDNLADTVNQADANRILRILREHGRMKHSELLYALKNRMKAREFKEVIDTLKESGSIKCESQTSAGRTGSTTFYWV